MLFNSESHPPHILNERKFGISNPWCLWKPSEFYKHPNSCRADTVWGLGLDLGSLSSPEKVAEQGGLHSIPFHRSPQELFVWASLKLVEMVPAVCVTASDNDATELLIMFNNFNCTRLIPSFPENKTCPLCHAQVDHIQQETEKSSWEAEVCTSVWEALTPAWALQVPVLSSRGILQHFAIKLLLPTRAYKKNEDQT